MPIKIVDSTDTANTTQANLIVANKPTISSLVWASQRIGTSSIISILMPSKIRRNQYREHLGLDSRILAWRGFAWVLRFGAIG